jgi:hypothetical protein
MKAFLVVSSLFLLSFGAGRAGAQESCGLDIVGTWEAEEAGAAGPTRYRFGADGMVTALARSAGGDWAETPGSTFRYRLDDPRAPKSIAFLPKGSRSAKGSLEISAHDDVSFTTVDPDPEPTRWVRVDPFRYFVVLAARNGPPRTGGPALAMLVKTDGRDREVEAFGFHLEGGERVVGPIPAPLRDAFMSEPRSEDDVMLRVELNPAEFRRSQRVLQSWQRRSRERTLLYDVPYLNSIVFLEEMAKSLNKCAPKLRLYDLTWTGDDVVISKNNLTHVPFHYIKELRKRNQELHVSDERFTVRASR